MNGVASVFAGFGNTMVIKQDGTFWAMGNNSNGQLGDGTRTNKYEPVQVMNDVVSVSGGDRFTMILKQDGTLWAAGLNNWGQFGDGDGSGSSTTVPRPVWPIQYFGLSVSGGGSSGSFIAGTSVTVTAYDSIAKRRGFDHWGGPDSLLISNDRCSTSTITMPSKLVMVNAVFADLYILTVDGGRGSASYFPGTKFFIDAYDSTANKKIFDHWGGPDSIFVLNDLNQNATFTMPPKDALVKAIYQWGYRVAFNKNGGDSDAFPKQSVLVPSGSHLLSTPAVPLRLGYYFAGWNTNPVGGGELFSDSSIITTDITVYAQWIKWKNLFTVVSSGRSHTMVIGQDGILAAMGYNYDGQLGIWDGFNKAIPAFIMGSVSAVSAGGGHTMILKNDGSLWATGFNSQGQLGDGTTRSEYSPIQVMSGVRSVSSGNIHTVVLKQDGTVWAMGNNKYGQLGVGDTFHRWTPVQVTSGASAVSAGYDHTMILKQDGTLWAMGNNENGELGTEDTVARKSPVQVMIGVSAVSAGGYHTMVLKQDKTLWAMGYNFYGQLGTGDTINRKSAIQVLSNVSTVSAGGLHTMIIKPDGTLWATGENGSGQLGDESSIKKITPIQVMSGVSAVSAGWSHTMILKKDATVWAVGSNYYGQLGDGTIVNKSTPVQVMPVP
jgi:alpha-tubulin suppressor-like RCC1 family protein